MVAFWYDCREDVRFPLPAPSVFTRKAARKWQTREGLTRMLVWDGGLLLNELG